MAVLEVRDLAYWYRENQIVFENTDLTFEQGKIYVILGSSGSGKTTLLSLLGGLDVPKKGGIFFNGQDIAQMGLNNYRRNGVSFVFQNYNLIEYMTALENVRLINPKATIDALTRVGLTEDEGRRNVLKLSGGQQQRVAVARALASEAPIILADEPTGNLDEETAKEIMNLFVENAKTLNKCIIIVSHSSQVSEMADVLLKFEDGKINVSQSA